MERFGQRSEHDVDCKQYKFHYMQLMHRIDPPSLAAAIYKFELLNVPLPHFEWSREMNLTSLNLSPVPIPMEGAVLFSDSV